MSLAISTEPGCDVLLLAAFEPELAPLRSVLGDALRGRVGAADVAARAVGIGLPRAAVGATLHISELRPRVAVVAIGTCGAYVALPEALSPDARAAPPLGIGDVVAARRICLADGLVIGGEAQFPGPMSTAIERLEVLLPGFVRAGARPVDVATALAITVSDGAAARVARGVAAQVEHLEAFGVATACAERGTPFGAVLGVANTVGRLAREEWKAHHVGAAAAAVGVVVRWLLSLEGA